MKNIIKIIALSTMFSMVSIHTIKAEDISDSIQIDNTPVLMETEIFEDNNKSFEQEVYLVQSEEMVENGKELIQNSYLIDINEVNPAYVIQDTVTNTYTFNRLSYAVKCSAKVKY